MKILLLVALLFGATAAGAGELQLSSPRVATGGVVRLHYRGAPPVLAVARWNDRLIYLEPDRNGAHALLGADLALAPGSYPLTLAVVDRSGASQFFRSALEVFAASFREERLTLPEAMVNPRDPAVLARIKRESKRLAALFAKETPGFRAGPFRRPVPDPAGSSFGLRRILNGSPRSPHSGVDFRSPLGRRVLAAGAGRVVFAGALYFTGNTVILDHGEGLYTLYAHLQTLNCRTGTDLEGGVLLGRVGSSGRSTGPHLHWGAKLRGARIDPLALIAVAGKSLDSPRTPGNNEHSPDGGDL